MKVKHIMGKSQLKLLLWINYKNGNDAGQQISISVL